MNYLILGSSGQIGTNLLNFLRQKNHVVVEWDIINNETQDLRKYNLEFENAIINSDFIFFLAFDVGGSRYLKKYQYTYEFIDNNVMIMKNVFDLINKHKKPFIFTSSQMSNMSYSPYGILKSLGEQYTKILHGLIVKFWNVYGFENNLEKSHVVTDFILSAKNYGKIDMLTDGTELRQFLYVDDCSECLEILSTNYENIPRNEELHITNFKWDSVLNVARIVSDYFGKIEINPNTNKDLIQLDKRNEPNNFILNYWKPKTSLKDGIETIIKKYEYGN